MALALSSESSCPWGVVPLVVLSILRLPPSQRLLRPPRILSILSCISLFQTKLVKVLLKNCKFITHQIKILFHFLLGWVMCDIAFWVAVLVQLKGLNKETYSRTFDLIFHWVDFLMQLQVSSSCVFPFPLCYSHQPSLWSCPLNVILGLLLLSIWGSSWVRNQFAH